jgi:hypothetical protein
MALYVPAGARRRRLVLGVVGGVVLGLVVGFLLGRASSPDLADDVADVQSQAVDATTALQRTPIEYEQAVAGEGGESTDTITGALDRAQQQLDDAYAAAIWLPESASSPTDQGFDAIDSLVADEASPTEFEAAVDALVAQIETTFGIADEGAG